MNPIFTAPTNQADWNAAIISEGVHIKWHEESSRPQKYPASQLSAMLASYQSKKARMEGEISSRITAANGGDMLAEADVEIYWRLDKFIQVISKEIEFREAGTFERSPVGTTYYIDPANGDDGADGLTSTGDATNGPWATIRKFMEGARAAGDVGICRRDITDMSDGTRLTATVDGDIFNPIIIEADYDDTWSDFADSAQTYTVAAGAKTMAASATITGVSVGDWVYVSGEDSRLHCLEVKAVSGTTLTFHLPYVGLSSGAGKTLVVMGPNPTHGSTPTADLIYFNTSYYWVFRGFHVKGAYGQGAMLFSNARVFLENIVLQGTHSGTQGGGMKTQSYAVLKFRNFRFLGGNNSEVVELAHNNGVVIFDHGEIDGAGQGSSPMLRGIFVGSTALQNIYMSDVYVHGVANGIGIEIEASATLGTLKAKNVTFSDNSAGDVEVQYQESVGELTSIIFEDYNGIKGNTKFFSGNGPAEIDSPWAETDTGVVRSGGAAASLKVTPSISIGGDWDLGGYPILGDQCSNLVTKGIPIYFPDAGTKTVKFYFKTANTTDWTANPTAEELYIEVEHLVHSSNVSTSIKRSSETLDFINSTEWQSISVSLTVGQSGLAYVRILYSKTKESAKSNVFYFDPYIDMS